jgi:DNA invertase Pin-like site-specific DNA recombinase/C4-type Zn-finger protein
MEQQGYYQETNTIGFETLGNPALYNAGLYARFSKDDGQATDNSSIQTQQMTLEKYCRDNGFKVYGVYKDDGYTGLNFDRPDFQRMLKDIEDGKVNLVITKDLSRLGRDYIMTGYYTDIYFTDHNVRYIAVNDGVDTLKADNDIVPFRNILNDLYSKDISRKVKSAKRQRALNGLFINPQAPYGYKKHPDTCNKLVADGEAAEVVKEIFRLALEGYGRQAIAKALTARHIMIPSAYKTAQGLKGFGYFNRKYKADYDYTWKYTTVMNILRDRVYIGDMVNRKFEVMNYKTKKCVAVPKEKHIVVQNTHEAIVNRDDFQRVQEMIAARHTPPKYGHDNIFRGILFCSECGKRMSLSNQRIKSVGGKTVMKSFYRCMNHYNNPDECTRYNYVYYDDLYNQISSALRKAVAAIANDEGLLKEVQKRVDGKSGYVKLYAEKTKIDKRLTALTAVVRRLYEDRITEVLDDNNYQSLLKGYQAEQKALSGRLTVIDGELAETIDYEKGFKKLKMLAAVYADCTELTAEMLNRLVERIEISHPQRLNSKQMQNISIIYRFIGSAL